MGHSPNSSFLTFESDPVPSGPDALQLAKSNCVMVPSSGQATAYKILVLYVLCPGTGPPHWHTGGAGVQDSMGGAGWFPWLYLPTPALAELWSLPSLSPSGLVIRIRLC